MHRVHCDIRNVQAVREPRVLCAQRRRQARHGQEVHAVVAVIEVQRLAPETPEDQRRDHDYSAASEADHQVRRISRQRQIATMKRAAAGATLLKSHITFVVLHYDLRDRRDVYMCMHITA